MKIYTDIKKTNFVYPEIKEEDFVFGSATEVAAIEVNPDHDWRFDVPPEEDQARNGVESSSCFVAAQTHADATYQEGVYGIKDQNFSERWILVHSKATPSGGDPLKAAQAIRDYGMIPDELLPFSDDIHSWEEFNSLKGGNETKCKEAGEKDKAQWDRKYDIIFRREEDVKVKYTKAKQALGYTVPCVSVHAWVQNEKGEYIKLHGANDNHFVELLYIDEQNRPWIRDTYAPYIKTLEPFYNFDFGMRRLVFKKKDELATVPSVFDALWKNGLIRYFADFIARLFGPTPPPLPSPLPPPAPVPAKSYSELLKEAVLSSLGQDLSTFTDNSVACVEAGSKILQKVYKDFPTLLSTVAIFQHFKLDKRFKGTLDIKPWQVILCVTGWGNGTIPNGHLGFIGESSKIYSNDSSSGKFLNNYTLGEWIERYRNKGGFKIYLFDLV